MKINHEDENRIEVIDLGLIRINTDDTNFYGTKISAT